MPPKKRTRTSPASDVSKRSKQGRSPPQHQEGTSFVSLTMESEVVTVKEELSGPETANLSDSITSLRLWCQDCGENAAESCVDSGHFLCSLRQLRLKQAAPKQQRLDKIASSAREVVKALQDARDELEAQLEQWRGRLRLLQEAEKELWAAVDEGRDLEEPALEEGLEQMLHDTTSLLRAKCKLQMDGSSSTWRAELPEEAPGSRRSLLFPLVLQLHRDKSLIKVFRPDECLDVHELSMPREHCQELDDALQNPGLDKVRKLDGVCCQERPNWCKLLLQRVAPHVEWLRVCNAVREHLEVITDMPALRYLRAHIIGARDAPDLPLQLQDLQLTNSSEEHFHCVQRMANLRKLSLKCHRVLDVTFPLLPASHCGLQWLSVSLRPASTVLSLATAHAATLQELRILCASEGDDPWHFKDLAEGLRQCGLVALRRVVLMRGSAPGYPTKKLPHAAESCQRQKQDVWDKLLATGSDRPVSIVKVMCKDCDDCPAFPLLGDFTWIDE